MELSTLKRDRGLFMAVLGIDKEGQHLPCPFHNGSDSFRVWRGDDGVWLWKCWAGCGYGTIIDAAMRKYRKPLPGDAIRGLEEELGITIGKDEEYQEPRLDLERAEEFIKDAHQHLLASTEIQQKYMSGKRGLTLEVVDRFKVGFMECAKFKGKNWRVFGWVLPIRDASGILCGVKLHAEKEPWPGGPKCLWAPFGTYPLAQPKNGCQTLWPPPELWPEGAEGFFCPGELKALAMIAAGKHATAPTSGENKLPERLVKRVAARKPSHVFIPFDDDAPKQNPISKKWVSAGNAWKETMIEAFTKAGVVSYAFSYGSPLPEVKHEAKIQVTAERKQETAERKQETGVPVLPGERANRACKPEGLPVYIAEAFEEMKKERSGNNYDERMLPAIDYSPNEKYLIEWYAKEKKKPGNGLPKPPFDLGEGITIEEGFYAMLDADILEGFESQLSVTGQLGPLLQRLKNYADQIPF